MVRTLLPTALLAAVIATLPGAAAGQASLTVSGNPGALVVSTAFAGSQPDAVSDNSTTYSYTADATSRITAELDQALPSGLTLEVTLAAPSGATSQGPVALSITAQDVVTGIPTGSDSGLTITYRLSATVDAGVHAPFAPVVTFTLASP